MLLMQVFTVVFIEGFMRRTMLFPLVSRKLVTIYLLGKRRISNTFYNSFGFYSLQGSYLQSDQEGINGNLLIPYPKTAP